MGAMVYNGNSKTIAEIVRRLNQGGGGSNVEITPILLSGTKIAEYEIDGTQGELFAPSGGEGGGGSFAVLDSNIRSETNTSFTLNDNISNYDFIVIDAYYSSASYANQYPASGIYKASDLIANAVIWMAGGNLDRSIQLQIIDDTHYKILTTRINTMIKGVYGIKFGGGSGGTSVMVHTTAEWQQLTSLVSEKGGIYVWSDYKTEDGENIPAIKIGDGLAYVVDLPFATQAITLSQIQSWNNKVSARVSGENLILEN